VLIYIFAAAALAAPHLMRCTVANNSSGISIVDGGQGVFTDCTLTGNGAVQVEALFYFISFFFYLFFFW
jgi:parallel beta-helix repeat protein